ncbi:MAG: transcription termination/antitermination protein NusA [Bryobacterales bacterium]|nr:transcription termination/antitermination protein NusA [Bryobacterales bacterium]
MPSIYQSIEILGKEKGIDPQVILDAVKDALLVAARKHFRTNEDMAVDFDSKGGIQLFLVKRVAESVADPLNELTLDQAVRIDPQAQIGGTVRIPRNADALGRISAQTAKQVILQKVREAERETIYSEFSGRVGELVNCTVKRIEAQDMVVDLGKTEARLPKKEQSKLESFSVGDRIRCVIKSVEKTGKNAGVIVSRGDAQLVVRLFEQEVPEIYDNTVVIKGCAREAGERTKIAVWSRDRDVDSVGACVGMKGMRVQSIIRELRGEKIDIIEYSEDAVAFATHALSPAKITRVAIVSAQDRHMEVIVEDSQLSLAIGKKGQNVRLAAKLLGWRIDIKSEEEKRQEVESAMAALVVPGAPASVLGDYGLDDSVLDTLFQAGVTTVERLGEMTPEELEQVPGMTPVLVELIQNAVHHYYSQFEESEQDGHAHAAPEEGTGGGPTEAVKDEHLAAVPAASNELSTENESGRIETPVEGAEG